ncbi:MAG: DUF192 domain-containing protein [Planctomycetota bacterium]
MTCRVFALAAAGVLTCLLPACLTLLPACGGGGPKGPEAPNLPPWIHGDFPEDLPRPVHERAGLELAGQKIEVELAVTNQGQAYGLMFVEDLPEDKGMLFVYPVPHRMRFWMRNTKIPLDIAYIAELGDECRVVNIHSGMRPYQEDPVYPSLGICRFALELRDGWAGRHGLKAGDLVKIPAEVLQMQSCTDAPRRGDIPRRIGR